jgi:GGDEF domain-containing protein
MTTSPTIHSDPAVRCYLELIRVTAGALGEICPQIGAPYQDRLNRLHRRLAFETSPDALDQSEPEIEHEIAECTQRTGEYIDQIWNDVLSVLSLVTRSTDAMAARNAFYSARLRQFAQDMGARSLDGDREEIEHGLALDAAGIESCVDKMGLETEQILAQFRHEIQSVATKLADARASVILDPSTGLINRREMERKMMEAIASPTETSFLRFAIDDLSSHAKRLGADAATNLERQFATRLADQIRPGDIASKWSPGRFAVILRCPLIEAGPRTAQIARALEGEYSVSGTPVAVHVLQDVAPEAEASSAEILFPYLDAKFPEY